MSIAELIEAVEAGHDQRVLELSYYFGGNYTHVIDAFRGSLDAAMALHEALLPGWHWNIVLDAATVWPKYPGDPTDAIDSDMIEGNPARAWLLAILRAKEAGQ
jgi:hypothetical protein